MALKEDLIESLLEFYQYSEHQAELDAISKNVGKYVQDLAIDEKFEEIIIE